EHRASREEERDDARRVSEDRDEDFAARAQRGTSGHGARDRREDRSTRSAGLSRADGNRHHRAGANPDLRDQRLFGQQVAAGPEGDHESWQVDTGRGGIAGFDDTRVALDELRPAVLVETFQCPRPSSWSRNGWPEPALPIPRTYGGANVVVVRRS